MKANGNVIEVGLTKRESEYLELMNNKIIKAYNTEMTFIDYILKRFPVKDGWVFRLIYNGKNKETNCHFINKNGCFDELYFGIGFKNIFIYLGYPIIEDKLLNCCFYNVYARRHLKYFEIITLSK